VSESGEFEDESLAGRHSVPGTLTMCNHGVDTNNSVVFVSNRPMPHLDGRFVVFGRVVSGLDAVSDLSNVFSVRLRPVDPIKIVDCGQVRA
jgi:cyclophilin family peptidyl-prolyl cis-trans isomerase